VVAQVYAVDSGQPVTSVMTLARLLQDDELATPRFNMILLSVFASLGLVLAVIGVYGVMSAAVAQETQEIGVRMALGAGRRQVLEAVMGEGLRLVALGAAVGLIGGWALGRVLAGLLYRVSAVDPLSLVLVTAVLGGVAALACWLPARRAASVDPLTALRWE
jgi:putative ABC transport system permease protein